MNAFERADVEFVAKATDDSQRKIAIERLSKGRRMYLWLVLLLLVFLVADLVFLSVFTHNSAFVGPLAMAFLILISLINLKQSDSDLKLLKLVERLQKDKDVR